MILPLPQMIYENPKKQSDGTRLDFLFSCQIRSKIAVILTRIILKLIFFNVAGTDPVQSD